MKRKVTLKNKTQRIIFLFFALLGSGLVGFFSPILGIFSLVVGFSFYILFGWKPLIINRRLFENGTQAPGIITEIHRSTRGGTNFYVKYLYCNQVFIGREGGINFNNVDLSINQKVTVFLDPEKPELFSVLEGSEYNVTPSVIDPDPNYLTKSLQNKLETDVSTRPIRKTSKAQCVIMALVAILMFLVGMTMIVTQDMDLRGKPTMIGPAIRKTIHGPRAVVGGLVWVVGSIAISILPLLLWKKAESRSVDFSEWIVLVLLVSGITALLFFFKTLESVG